MKTTLAGLACGFAVLGVDGALAQTPVNFQAAASGQIMFVMPAQNIGCTYTPKGGTGVYKPFDGGPELSCDQSKPRYTRVVLTPKTVRHFKKVGDQDGVPEDNTFKPGTRWMLAPFTCDATAAALNCQVAGGRSFSIDKAGIKVK